MHVTKKRIDSIAKYAGIATVSVEWFALLLFYLRMPSYFGGRYPLSYFATFPQTKLAFTICYTLAAFFFWIYVKYHLHKYYQAPLNIFAWSMLLFVCVAVIPFNPDNAASSIVHGSLAWSAAMLFTLGTFILARNSNNKSVFRASLFTILLSIILIVAYAISPKDSRLIFAFEAGSWFVWQIWTLWISYYSLSSSI